MWQLTWGSKIESLKQIARDSGETPVALANRPSLNQFTQPYFAAYQLVRRGRTWTQAGPADIPPPVLYQYLDEQHITDWDERALFVDIIYALDDTYLEHSAKKVAPNG